MCGADEETTFHVLVECTYARLFWAKMLDLAGVKLPKLCHRTWAADLMDDSFCSVANRGVIMCGMWSLWNSHNDKRHGKTVIEPRRAIEWAMVVCLQLLSDGQQSTDSVVQKKELWEKPPVDHIKVTTDGVFCAIDCTGATRAVVRYADGSFIKASTRRLPTVASVLAAEAEAFKDGVRLIPQGTREGIIVETDSEELVSLWPARKEGRSETSAILKDVQEISATFSSFVVTHVRRSANVAAHVCAK
jgi:hypothetical protein